MFAASNRKRIKNRVLKKKSEQIFSKIYSFLFRTLIFIINYNNNKSNNNHNHNNHNNNNKNNRRLFIKWSRHKANGEITLQYIIENGKNYNYKK